MNAKYPKRKLVVALNGSSPEWIKIIIPNRNSEYPWNRIAAFVFSRVFTKYAKGK
jgi:hypothetical protein